MYSTRAASGSRPLIRPASAGLRTSPAGLRAHPAGLLVPPPSDPGFAAHRCATSAAHYYTVFTRYCTVLPSHPIVVHTVRAPGKGSLDLFSLDLPLPASCEPASVQGSPLQDSRFFRRKLQYKVKWKGYGYEDASWEPVENIAHARDLVREFHRRHPDAPRQVRGICTRPGGLPDPTCSSRRPPPASILPPPASVLVPPDSSFLHRRIQWKGYGYEDASWEPVENVAHARDLVREFHRRHPDAPKQVRGLFLVDPAALRATRTPVHRGAAP
ncbi:putative retrotransposable element tf2 155 kda protein type 1-like [Lyophyllum shimeji]|uniref:Retrotransposable element tf2 155 kDa protein type 1-like n=1 Tax=Lyophyllum shimeji TaxID=47721 RepID=A0A9P3UKF7_LYOSH|nr:putative retrotransposable element tf2 155 kda protein type 1-like [Lyophyllum shimeji]